jgi:hypothetical protein
MADRTEPAKNARVPYKDVETSPPIRDGGAEPIDGIELHEVQRYQSSRSACRANSIVGFLEAALGARYGDHVSPGCGQTFGDCGANSP